MKLTVFEEAKTTLTLSLLLLTTGDGTSFVLVHWDGEVLTPACATDTAAGGRNVAGIGT